MRKTVKRLKELIDEFGRETPEVFRYRRAQGSLDKHETTKKATRRIARRSGNLSKVWIDE